MTATARKPRTEWREEPEEDDSEDDGGGVSDEEALAAKASQLEWDHIEKEVREEKRRLFANRNFTSGRGQEVAAYGDVAGEFREVARGPPPRPEDDAASDGEAPLATASVSSTAGSAGGSVGGTAAAAPGAQGSPADVADKDERPSGAVTAGRVTAERDGERRRGGKKLAERKRKKEAAAEGAEEGEETEEAKAKRLKKQEEEEEEAKKWLRLKLDGIEKPRRIKAARVVYYYDHDSKGSLFPKELPSVSTGPSASSAGGPVPEVSSEAAVPAEPGNFRASLRRDLFKDDSDDED